ncbi:MAG: hypothetical protein ABSH50_28360 [Bryobacteraceae bacterium]|jgi:hypothetical protein
MNPLAVMLHPLACYALLALGLSLSLCLFVTLKIEWRRLARSQQAGRQELLTLQTALNETRAALQGIEDDLRDVERQTGMLVAPQPARSGLNLGKRTQVLRLHRAGYDNAGIATTLALPRAEVDLLIKVHRLVVGRI